MQSFEGKVMCPLLLTQWRDTKGMKKMSRACIPLPNVTMQYDTTSIYICAKSENHDISFEHMFVMTSSTLIF